MSYAEASALATDPAIVAKHPFFPFISFEEKWKKFGKDGPRKDREKKRVIQYAARGDSYIYEYYRHILSQKYENQLIAASIEHIPIAYRKIRSSSGRGCSNIDFARDAFEKIQRRREGIVIALDISKFFDNICHKSLKSAWQRLLGCTQLPADHYAVYRSITKYSTVDRDALYTAFDIKERVSHRLSGATDSNSLQCQICEPRIFEKKAKEAKRAGLKLVSKNANAFGIPQGSPISDLLANIILFDFDKKCNEFCKITGSYYRRYSDDIIFIIPKSYLLADEIKSKIQIWLADSSPRLELSDKKTRIHEFNRQTDGVSVTSITKHQCPLEYLGFQFDGKQALFRSSTLSSLSRKIKSATHAFAYILSSRFKSVSVADIMKSFNVAQFLQNFFRVYKFREKKSYIDMSFWSYARLAERRMGSIGRRLLKQISNMMKIATRNIEQSLMLIHRYSEAIITTPAAPPPLAPAPAA